jgi:hypothetical protein
MSYEFSRNLKDKNYVSTVNVAQAGSNSAIFDLEQVIGGDIEGVVVQVQSPAIAGISDSKVLSYTVKDSADGTTFTTLAVPIVASVTGASSAGVTAKDFRFRLPPGTRRYVVVEQALTATAGTVTGAYTTSLLF